MLTCAGFTEVLPFGAAGLAVSAADDAIETADLRFRPNDDGTLRVAKVLSRNKEIVIPGEINGMKVTKISKKAFYNAVLLEKITIPETVTEIGEQAFEGCFSLKDTGLTSGIKTIGKCAYKDCRGLHEVTIPGNIDTVSTGIFAGCTRLQRATIKSGVNTISSGAFLGCLSLKELIIEDGLERIEGGAFENCYALKSIEIPDSTLNIGAYAFTDTAWYKSQPDGDVYLGKVFLMRKGTDKSDPKLTIKSGTRAIAANALWTRTQFTSVELPDSLEVIGETAFFYCTGLTSIKLPKRLRSIGGNAFLNCDGLESIEIPDSVTELGYQSFSGCKSLVSVKLPQNLSVLESAVFGYCDSLRSIKLPADLKELRSEAFTNCTSLESIELPEGLTKIDDLVFSGCSSLRTVIIPDTVTAIYNDAFLGCDKLTIYGKKGSYAENYAKINGIPFVEAGASLTNTSYLSSESVTLGRIIKVRLSAVSGASPLRYTVQYKKTTGNKWTTLIRDTKKTAVALTPKAAVSYDVRVTVKDKNGKSSVRTLQLTVNKPLTNVSKLSSDSITLGERVKIRCYAKGGEGEYTYAVYCKKASHIKWTKLRGYTSGNALTFRPTTATQYHIRVDAKDKSGRVESKILTLSVVKK